MYIHALNNLHAFLCSGFTLKLILINNRLKLKSEVRMAALTSIIKQE